MKITTDRAIGRFLKNPTISVNIFGYKSVRFFGCIIYPLRISETQGRKNEIDLLFIDDGEKNSTTV